jgi:Leucine-rich repeat (LRR) protein
MSSVPAIETINLAITNHKTFDKTQFPSVKTIQLSRNKVMTDFPDLPNTSEQVDLSDNGISEVPAAKVTPLIALRHLNLQYNIIASFYFDMLLTAPNLVDLLLRSNNFITIPDLKSYSSRSSKLKIFFEGNPLECDHRLEWLKSFNAPNLEVIHSEKPCHYSPKLRGMKWMDISVADLWDPSMYV